MMSTNSSFYLRPYLVLRLPHYEWHSLERQISIRGKDKATVGLTCQGQTNERTTDRNIRRKHNNAAVTKKKDYCKEITI